MTYNKCINYFKIFFLILLTNNKQTSFLLYCYYIPEQRTNQTFTRYTKEKKNNPLIIVKQTKEKQFFQAINSIGKKKNCR